MVFFAVKEFAALRDHGVRVEADITKVEWEGMLLATAVIFVLRHFFKS